MFSKGVNCVLGGFMVLDTVILLFFFILLMVLVVKFAWGPVMDMMQKREDHIAEQIDVAETNRVEAEKASKEAAERLQETRQEAQKIIDDAKNAGQQQEQSIIEAARAEAERIKIAAQEEIRNEKDKALQSLQDQVASLSVLIASKVIEKEISAQDQDKLIAEYVKEVGEEQ